jgi:phosphoribosylformimino-5-aminoimidazole carboxamide ribotide isomerase
MRIIIAIDIIEGKCVRLTKGDFTTSKIYFEDPLEAAKQIEDSGIRFIHLVDLDGARTKKIVNHKILEKIALNTTLTVDFGGGIRSEEDLKTAFDYGANQVTCGSTAVYNRVEFIKWVLKYGPERIILGADSIGRKILTNGWMKESEIDIITFINDYYKQGVRYTICTDIEKDGMLQGPSLTLYEEIIAATRVNLIASGGVSTIGDVVHLEEAGCEGAIIGKAVYEGKLTLEELAGLC